jgi:hypothetical protein
MILDQKVTYFKGTRETTVAGSWTIKEALESIKTGTFKADVLRVRAGDTEAKKQLPTVAMHGLFEFERKKNNFIEASGLIILDIDDCEDDLEDIKRDIMDCDPSVLSVMVSPSGDGIKVLYYVSPELVTADTYRDIGKQLVTNFEIYGKVDYLSITDCLIMTYDPNILINEEAEPAFIFINNIVITHHDLEKRDESKNLWEDVEDFFYTVLSEDIASKTNNNFHYIQVAILDLAKFGFLHPKEDLSFVIDFAEEAFKQSPENKRRFLEMTEIAKSYPQQFWPYKRFNEDDEEEPEIDYAEFKAPKQKQKEKVEGEAITEVEESGLIDYDIFFDSMVEVIQEGDRVGREISLKEFADIFRFKGSGILTITGIPGDGKTEFVDACALDLARIYNEETFIVGFEQTPEEHVIKLIRKLLGANVTCKTWFNDVKNSPKLREAYEFITSKIKHIDTRRTSEINEILRSLAVEIKKARESGGNPRYVVMDPFNMLSIKARLSGHEKIEEILRRITHFSHQMEVMVILVAHPFKMRKDEKTGIYEVPDFYSVKGSSAFYEMSYHGLVIYRRGTEVMVRVLKVKQNNLGRTGAEVWFGYDRDSGRYIPHDEEGLELEGDHRDRDWLQKIETIK